MRARVGGHIVAALWRVRKDNTPRVSNACRQQHDGVVDGFSSPAFSVGVGVAIWCGPCGCTWLRIEGIRVASGGKVTRGAVVD
jgi:hypothetical protein